MADEMNKDLTGGTDDKSGQTGDKGKADTTGGTTDNKSLLDDPKVKELLQAELQREADKIRTKYSSDNKNLLAELEKFKTEKMSTDEKSKYELETLKKSMEEKERALNQRDLTLKTIDLLKDEGLSLEFKDFVLGENIESTITKTKSMKAIFNKAVKEAVEAKLKDVGGAKPPSGSGSSTDTDGMKAMRAALGLK